MYIHCQVCQSKNILKFKISYYLKFAETFNMGWRDICILLVRVGSSTSLRWYELTVVRVN
jgi:hypothetical protein